MKKTRSAIRIPMPLRYLINLVLILALWFVLYTLIQNGTITNYWSGILITVGINIILATSLNVATGYLGQLPLGHAGFMAVGAYAGGIFMKAVPVQELLKSGNTGAAIPYIPAGAADQCGRCRYLRHSDRHPGAASARRLSGNYHAGLRRDHPRDSDEYRLCDRYGFYIWRSRSEAYSKIFLIYTGVYLRGRVLLYHPHDHEVPPWPCDLVHP